MTTDVRQCNGCKNFFVGDHKCPKCKAHRANTSLVLRAPTRGIARTIADSLVELLLPWKEGTTAYEDDGPAECVEFTVAGHKFKVRPTDLLGCNTLRRRYWVECLTCNEVIHEATTSATIRVEQHIEGG